MKVVNYVQIDFSRNKDITVPSIQYDSGTRWVMVKLYNNGVPIDLHDLKVFIMAVKPDGKEVFNNCNVIDPDDGLIKFEITEQMGFVKGEVECQIKLMDQDRLLSSDIFKLNVNKSLSFENSESTNQLTTLVDALYRVEHLDAELSGEFRDTFNASQLEREESFNDSQMDREEVFNSSQLNREETFNVSETERENIFDNSQVNHEERFNASQAEREDKFNDKLDQFEERFLEIKGEKGDEGDKGDKGDKGEQGPVGPQGPKGDKGDRGLDGRGVELGVYGGQVKWRYAGQAENVGWTSLISLDSLKGAQGPIGLTGPQGPKGDKGDQGEVGPIGPQGEKGEKGDSGVIISDMVDYMGNQHESLKAKNDADVDWLLREINTTHYEGQYITATDSIEGRAKSAILKGQTLVNVLNGKVNINNNVHYNDYLIDIPFKPNTVYTAIFNVSTDATSLYCGLTESSSAWNGSNKTFENGLNKISLTPTSDATYSLRIRHFNDESQFFDVSNVMLIEGDYTNNDYDIPYFEGMQSVRMPVLTTMGVNIFEGETERGYIDPSTGQNSSAWNDLRSVGYTEVIGGNTIRTLVTNERFSNPRIYEYDENKNFIGRVENNILSPHAKFVRFSIGGNTDVGGTSQVMLYYGDVIKREYEPYKSNILSTPQDLELRGIGNVKDTLDLMTGDVTERVGEVVLDGSENWIKNDIYTGTSGSRFVLEIDDIKKVSYGKILCDKMQVNSNVSSWQTEGEYISADETNISRINIRKTQDMTIEEFKQWLSQNPITVQYQLATESVKTVVFKEVDQDGNETVHENGAIVYSHKDTTHYICGSEDSSLIPSLSIDVPTNLPAVVTRQKTMIHELEVENKALIDELQRVEEKSDQADLEQLSTTWEIDYRVSELEWFVEDNISSTMTVAEKINLKLGGNTMALSRFEQAKILILAGAYNRETLEKQLTNYLKRGYLTTEEYDELIALMDAKELVSEN